MASISLSPDRMANVRKDMESCVTRHGNNDCKCKTNLTPKLVCKLCETFVVHQYIGEKPIKDSFGDRTGVDILFKCAKCSTVRHYGHKPYGAMIDKVVDEELKWPLGEPGNA